MMILGGECYHSPVAVKLGEMEPSKHQREAPQWPSSSLPSSSSWKEQDSSSLSLSTFYCQFTYWHVSGQWEVTEKQ